jgi:coenzyme PQQ biosynthesis protein PqqD
MRCTRTVSSHTTDTIQRAQFLATRPTLDSKVVVRADRRSGRCLLLYPERGLELSDAAEAIVRRCTGAYETREIIAHLVDRYGPEHCDVIEHDVCAFLHSLMDRGLVHAR